MTTEKTEEKQGLIVLESKSVMQAFSQDGGLDPIVAELKTRAESEVKLHDPSTPAGRKALISVSAGVRRSGTALDSVRKELCADWVAKKKAVDANWRVVKDQIKQIADDARQAVTDYETAEAEKQEKIKASMDYLENLPRREVDGVLLSAAQLKEKLTEAESFEIDSERFGDFAETAQTMLDNARINLKSFYEEKLKAEETALEMAEFEKMKNTLKEIEVHGGTVSHDGVPYHSAGLQNNIDWQENLLDGLAESGFSEGNQLTVKMKASMCLERLDIALGKLQDAEKAKQTERDEEARKDGILKRIQSFEDNTAQTIEMCTDSKLLAEKLKNIKSFEIEESVYQEFTDKAKVVALQCTEKIRTAHAEAVLREESEEAEREKEQAEQKKKDEEKKEADNNARIKAIEARIEEIGFTKVDIVGFTPKQIQAKIDNLNDLDLEKFDEFRAHALSSIKTAIADCVEAREAIQDAERQADQAHRNKLIKEASDALSCQGLDEADFIVNVIIDGMIPNISFKF